MAEKRKRAKAIIQKIKARKLRRREEKTTFWRRVLKALPLVFVGLLFVFYFSRTEAVQKFQNPLLDAQMLLDNPSDDSDVVIVEITQADFDTFFGGETRPLNPPKLHELVSAVSKGKPCVVGVDIDTHYRQFGAENFRYSGDWSPTIWARETKEIPPDVNTKPVPIDVLGGQTLYNKNSGFPLLIDDAQGVTRLYTRLIETADGEIIPSFAWAIYRQAAQENCAKITFPDADNLKRREDETSALFIRYSRGGTDKIAADSDDWNTANRGRIKIPSLQIIELSKTADWQNNSLIKDKIVLIGGSYGGEDVHQTPLGRMSGVEITANVIETELRGGGIKPPAFLTTALIALFDGFLLIGLFHLFPWRQAFLSSVAALFALSFVCSFLTFYSFSYWFLFAPVIFGVLLTELFDRLKDYLKEYYKTELENIYTRLTGRKTKKEMASADKK